MTGASESPRRPRRQPYVPKPSQRLLSVRTTVAKPTRKAAQTVQLIGQIVADPNGGGHVQATQSGRIEPAKGPAVCRPAGRGRADLADSAPAVTAVERSGVQQQIANVEQELTIAQARLERLRKLSGSVPQRDIDEAEATLNGLRKSAPPVARADHEGAVRGAPLSPGLSRPTTSRRAKSWRRATKCCSRSWTRRG